MNRKTIAKKAIIDALRMRQSAECGLDKPICVYDLAESLGIEVWFSEIPSMEGMYYKSPEPHIILSSLRPPGRRTFTCAHELAHHSRGDIMHVDKLVELWEHPQRFDPEEFAADCFAGALLMPKTAVEQAFALRHWHVNKCTPDQIYVISNYFRVGYTTLIHHLKSTLLLLPDSHAKQLLKVTPRQAQCLALGWKTPDTVWIVDKHWTSRAIDVEVGDLVFVHGQPILGGSCIEHVKNINKGKLIRAKQPGIGRLEDGSTRSVFVRVSRRNFIGRSIFRHLEEVDTIC